MCKLKVGFVDLWDYYFRPVIFRIKLFDSTLPKRPLKTESRLFSRANFKNDRGSSIHACHQSFPIREFRSLTNFCRGPLSASVWPRSRYANALLSHERFQPVTLLLLLSRLSIPKGSFSRLSLMSPRASSLQSPAIPTDQIFEQGICSLFRRVCESYSGCYIILVCALTLGTRYGDNAFKKVRFINFSLHSRRLSNSFLYAI